MICRGGCASEKDNERESGHYGGRFDRKPAHQNAPSKFVCFARRRRRKKDKRL
jgi:hypothetical protein